MKTTEERIAAVARYVPKYWKPLYRRCVTGEASRSEAIDCHCFECMGWANEECGCVACPLFAFRPFGKRTRRKREISEQQRAKAAERLAAVRSAGARGLS